MFTTLIVQPIFNLLVLIYSFIPGHNFGLALILFTVIIRLLMWPLVRRQLHQTKVMRKLQPEIKRIKKEAKGDRQKESLLLMELYKERGVNPLGTIPILIVQLIILIGLYSGLHRVIVNPKNIVDFAYPALQHLSWIHHLSGNIHAFDNTLFGSAIIQFLTSRQLMPTDKDARKLRHILRGASSGQQADQSEVNAAVGRSTQYIIPFMVFIFTVNLAAALSLYWLVGGLVAYIQQSVALRGDEQEMERIADKPEYKDVAAIAEAEVVSQPKPKPVKKKSAAKKRRKR
jgi:YidC/Oxa1 family membrane protein insertase